MVHLTTPISLERSTIKAMRPKERADILLQPLRFPPKPSSKMKSTRVYVCVLYFSLTPDIFLYFLLLKTCDEWFSVNRWKKKRKKRRAEPGCRFRLKSTFLYGRIVTKKTRPPPPNEKTTFTPWKHSCRGPRRNFNKRRAKLSAASGH